MDLRKTFNSDEYNYDKSRPDYPKELFYDIFDYVKLSENSNVLEIGIGTGQATLPFLNKGCNVTAVELGDKLARYCAQNFHILINSILLIQISLKLICLKRALILFTVQPLFIGFQKTADMQK